MSTDVGSRGLDSAHADLVLHIECAERDEVMAHRIGRGGRFGAEAESIFFASDQEEADRVVKFSKHMDVKITSFSDTKGNNV